MARLKICGLHRPEDVTYANEVGPDWAGFVVNFPKSHRSVSPAQLRALCQGLSDQIQAVGVFVDQPVELVAELLLDDVIQVAQLHGSENEEYLRALRAAAPQAIIWKAFEIRTHEGIEQARSSSADLVLLDSGKGSGQVMNWELIADMDRPYMLAGGMTPENIPHAIAMLHPYGIDISSGVETDRRKDKNKMIAAKEAVEKNE